MWRALRESLLSFGVVLICLASLGVLVHSYEHVAPTAAVAQNKDNAAPVQEAPKPIEAKNAQPPAPAPVPPQRGLRFFSKKARVTTLSERLGVRLETPSEELMVKLGLPEGEGLAVVEVRDGTTAANAGFKTGDILIELGGRNVPSDPLLFDFQLGDLKAGEPINALVLREGKSETLNGLILPEATARPFFFQFKKKPAPVEP